MFFLAVRIASASGSKSGAATTSVKMSLTVSAIAAVTGRLVAMTPPKADSGSHSWARRCTASIGSSGAPAAMPHGLACLMIATAGASKS